MYAQHKSYLNQLLVILFRLILIFVPVVLSQCSKIESEIPRANTGVLDLRDWDFEKSPVVSMDGEWEFFSNKFLSENPELERDGLIQVPGSWKNFRTEHVKQEERGIGTYRLKILTDENLNLYSLHVHGIGVAGRIYIDGVLIKSNGKVGKTYEEVLPSYRHPLLNINTQSNEMILTIEVSNFNHPFGGLRKTIQFGKSDALVRNLYFRVSEDLFLFGVTIIMGIYHIFLFTLRRSEYSFFWFGLICFFIGARALFTNTVFIYEYLDASNWFFIHKLDILSYSLLVPIIIKYFSDMYPEDVSRAFTDFVSYVFLVYSCLVIIFSSYVYMSLVKVTHVILVSYLISWIFFILKILKNKRENSYIMAFSTILFLVTGVNDILNQNLYLNNGYLLNYGLLGFLIAQIFLLSKRFVSTYNKIENLTYELVTKNKNLEELNEEKNKYLDRIKKWNEDLNLLVEQKTKEFKEEKDRAILSNEIKSKFLAIVSHDLRSPIVTVNSNLKLLLNKHVLYFNNESNAIIREAYNTLESSLVLINNLLNQNRVLLPYIDLDYELVELKSLIDESISMVALKAQEKNIEINNYSQPELVSILDKELMKMVLINILGNSIKFSENTPINIYLYSQPGRFKIKISDQGTGISEEHIPLLFLRDRKLTTMGTRGEKGNGLGLPFCKEIIELHRGEIHVKSVFGEGSEFTISLPSYDHITVSLCSNEDFSLSELKDCFPDSHIVQLKNPEFFFTLFTRIIPDKVILEPEYFKSNREKLLSLIQLNKDVRITKIYTLNKLKRELDQKEIF